MLLSGGCLSHTSHHKKLTINSVTATTTSGDRLPLFHLLKLKDILEEINMETVLQAGKLNTYRFCDNVWTFMLNDVEFREAQEMAKVDKVKIVACDGKSGFAV
jgi:hypothetical protein